MNFTFRFLFCGGGSSGNVRITNCWAFADKSVVHAQQQRARARVCRCSKMPCYLHFSTNQTTNKSHCSTKPCYRIGKHSSSALRNRLNFSFNRQKKVENREKNINFEKCKLCNSSSLNTLLLKEAKKTTTTIKYSIVNVKWVVCARETKQINTLLQPIYAWKDPFFSLIVNAPCLSNWGK